MGGTRSRQLQPAMVAAMARVRDAASTITDVQVSIDPQSNPLQRLLGLGETGFRVLVQGEDVEQLQMLAADVAARLAQIGGLTDISSRSSQGNPEIRLRVRRDEAAAYGVSVEKVARALQAALQGTISTQFVEFDRRIDIRVQALGDARSVDAFVARSALPDRVRPGAVPGAGRLQ